jgi:hypothetical protein
LISEGPALIEALPGELQSALNGALLPDEELLVSVRGNPREAFAATHRRVLVLKEPTISGTGPVEVRSASLADISEIRAVPRPVGGRLMWASTEAGAPTSIDYPTYDGSKYSLVAGRLQQMIGQTKNTPAPSAASTEPVTGSLGSASCPKCQTPVPAGGCWCPSCGLQMSDPCWDCGRPLTGDANFCSFCGTPNSEPAIIQCPQCRAVVGRGSACCTACGAQARPVCQACEEVMRKEWSFCPACGGEPVWSEVGSKPEVSRLKGDEPNDPSAWLTKPAAPGAGEDANAAGIRAYEAEKYEEAVRQFTAATRAEPNNSRYWTNLAVAYGELDDDEQAFAANQRALEVNPRELAAYLNLGYLYNGQEQSNKAREMWEKVIALAPDSDEAGEARENLDGLEHV